MITTQGITVIFESSDFKSDLEDLSSSTAKDSLILLSNYGCKSIHKCLKSNRVLFKLN
jgi:hypothetical protein